MCVCHRKKVREFATQAQYLFFSLKNLVSFAIQTKLKICELTEYLFFSARLKFSPFGTVCRVNYIDTQ